MKNKINQKESRSICFLKYIGIAVGIVLLSSWSAKASSFVVLQQELQEQTFKEITGVVKTEYGDPIPNVAILLVGSNQETETDEEGRYTLTAKQGDRARFVSEGFKTTTMTVSQSNILNVTMEEKGISKVVAEPYRTTLKNKMTFNKSITGVVKTQDGDPIPNIAVLLVETNQGTETDAEGRYTITAKQGDRIQFVYKGFKTTTMTVSESNILNIKMIKEDKKLSDIENYQTTITRSQSGSYDRGRPNLQLLQGGQVISLNIKRVEPDYKQPETILKDVEALTRNGNYTYVVGGVRVSEETFRSLNQNDIESIDVYKHSDITQALYGNKESQSKTTFEAR